MKKKNHLIGSIIGCLVTIFATIFVSNFFTLPVQAEAVTLQISPTKTAFETLDPNETVTKSFKVENTGDTAYSYTVEVSPYSVEGLDYGPNFEKATGYTEITDWITLESAEGTVKPNSSNEIKFTIKVPKDAPGGYQGAAIIVTLKNDDQLDGSGIVPVSRVAHIVFSNVSGDTRRTGSITENKVPSFLFNPPIVASSVVKNSGNIYTNATYRLEVYNFFGGKLAYTNAGVDKDGKETLDARVIFPDTERYTEVSWDGAPQLGLFKVKQTVKIFDEVDITEKIVFLCPIWFLFIILLVVAVVVFKIVSTILRRRNHDDD